MTDPRIAGKAALIVGGGPGALFCAEGGRVAFAGRNDAELETMAATIGRATPDTAIEGCHII